MLKELYIENLAIIEKAVITFDERLNIFSGETGAGKSILISGINAVLGGRVSRDTVRAGAEKAVVTALFEVEGGELLLTREISGSGSSIARINGKTVTASDLKEAASGLIDIHGQHETRLITSREVQLQLLDGFGGIDKTEYESAFREFSEVSRKINRLQKEDSLKEEKIEILSAKIEDILPYTLRKGEEEEVSRELNRLRNIAAISEMLNRAYSSLSGDDGQNAGAVDLVNLCKVSLGEITQYVPECKPLKERIEDVFIELDDIKLEISSLMGDSADIRRLPQLEERMSDFVRLKRKYGVDIDELIDKSEEWQAQLDELTLGDDALARLTDERKRLGDSVKTLAGELTRKRLRSADELSRFICAELEELDMPGIRLVFAITQDKVTITGMDAAEMLIAVNKGEEPKPMSRIASGGELSRIMLAIKTVLAGSDDVSVMVFDEVDTGISGRAAAKVAGKLSQLSKERQVLCVTHLAQIAAMADCHLLIEKSQEGGRTYTNVRRLCAEERKRELARIISGDDDELSIANAERLIEKKLNHT
jgi:DNA repair protein RecN (Recombination protein N)